MEFEMTYNSQEELMVISEYGRNIQNLVRHTKTIEDPEKRQAFAEKVIDLMYQMNPQSRNVLEYRTKLWNHFFMIGEYDIDVVNPSGATPTEDEIVVKPDKVAYPTKERDFRHYGHYVRVLMEKAIAMEDGPAKDEFTEVIASFMKLAYKNWNREHYVSDEIILEDLKSLSKGQLSVPENSSLDTLSNAVRSKQRRNPRNNRSNNNRSNNRRKGRNNNNNNRGRRR